MTSRSFTGQCFNEKDGRRFVCLRGQGWSTKLGSCLHHKMLKALQLDVLINAIHTFILGNYVFKVIVMQYLNEFSKPKDTDTNVLFIKSNTLKVY